MQKEEVLKFGEDDFLKTVDLKNITPKELTDLFKAESFAYANAQIQSKMEDVQKLGASISKLYMTGITVADSYGEAKIKDCPMLKPLYLHQDMLLQNMDY